VAKYAVVLARSARKQLEKLPAQVVERVFPKIESLALQPRPSGCKRLKGGENLWRIRVGDYRVVYSVNDSDAVADIIAVRHRSEAYRD
jgi:mRNA interferase RelE/StbE